MSPNWQIFLKKFGFDGTTRRPQGKGVVGKSTSGFLGFCGVLGIVGVGLAWIGQPVYLMAIAGLGFLGYLFFQHRVLDFADKNPAAAILEGQNLVRYKEIEVGAKNPTIIDARPSEPDPQNPILIEKLEKPGE